MLVFAEGREFTYPDWAKHRYYSISSEAPFLKHMLRQPGFNESSIIIHDFVTYIENNIVSFLHNDTSPRPRQMFIPCNAENKKFAPSVKHIFGIFGQPEPTIDCITDVIDTTLFHNEASPFTVDSVANAVEERTRLLRREKDKMLGETLNKWKNANDLLVDWKHPSVVSNSAWKRPDKKCELSVVGMMRVGDTWFSNMLFSNGPVHMSRKMYELQFAQEFYYIDPSGKKTRPMIQRFPSFKSEKNDGPFVRNTTTTFSRKGGQVEQVIFFPIPPATNPAIISAATKADSMIKHIHDALSPSSLMLLFLPATMTLFPIALVSYVRTNVLMAFMLLSDVLSIAPLAIKGVELIYIGWTTFRSVATRIHGSSNGIKEEAAGGELWVAECRSRVNGGTYGVVFIALAFVLMVLGIFLELWARQYVRRRHARQKEMKMIYNRIASHEHYGGESYKQTMRRESNKQAISSSPFRRHDMVP